MVTDIKGTLLESTILETKFCCDLPVCKGACCVQGELGAPVSIEDIETIEGLLDEIKPIMNPKSRSIIENEGIYDEKEGEYFLKAVDCKECVFVLFDDEHIASCVLEKAYHERGMKGYRKPLSCALFPIRLKKRYGLEIMTYEKLPICSAGREKDSHLRKYKGEDWIEDATNHAKELTDTL
ncbi:hypothetical protein CHS0354_024183 [Potamilus streckersoni]|uniref:DUF3109 domain-containing protein n=1 Tax=Potamilus streckersoni TaxID=2493646 RepID=A0AAE0VLT3_9BIVA|nr:hypothetical protein CHS0354_024183 [Potamilus streckersoni]